MSIFPEDSPEKHYKNSGTHELGLPRLYKNSGTHDLGLPRHCENSGTLNSGTIFLQPESCVPLFLKPESCVPAFFGGKTNLLDSFKLPEVSQRELSNFQKKLEIFQKLETTSKKLLRKKFELEPNPF